MKSHFILSLILLLVYAAPTSAAPLGTRTVLDNGATLLVAERPGIPMVVMNIVLKTGAAVDPDGKTGLANLTACTLDQFETLIRHRLKSLQYRPAILNGFIAGTSLTLESLPP